MPAVKDLVESRSIETLLAKAQKPSADAMRLHPYCRGKTEGDLYRKACDIIARSRDLTQWMMKRGFIAEAPE